MGNHGAGQITVVAQALDQLIDDGLGEQTIVGIVGRRIFLRVHDDAMGAHVPSYIAP